MDKNDFSNRIKEIISNTDIVTIISSYQNLDKKGKNYFGICPFHDDNTPSMSVSPEKQMFKCFTCGAGGDVVEYVSRREKIQRMKVIQKFANDLGVDFNFVEKNTIKYSEKQLESLEILEETKNYFMYSLEMNSNSAITKYLESRNITKKIIEKFEIGYANSTGLKDYLSAKDFNEAQMINAGVLTENLKQFFFNRIIFTIKNKDDKIVGFSGRALGEAKPKYINSQESNIFKKTNILYNLNNSFEIIKHNREVIVTEGFMDVIALYKADIENTVAIMGTAFTKEQFFLLPKNIKIKLMLDFDEAGINATISSINNLIKYNTNVFVVNKKDQKDADEIFNSKGKEGIEKVLSDEIHWLEFLINEKIFKNLNMNPNEIKENIDKIKYYFNFIDKITKNIYIDKISKKLNMPISLIIDMLDYNDSINISENNISKKTNTENKEKPNIKKEKVFSSEEITLYTIINKVIKKIQNKEMKDEILEEIFFTKNNQKNKVSRCLFKGDNYIIFNLFKGIYLGMSFSMDGLSSKIKEKIEYLDGIKKIWPDDKLIRECQKLEKKI
ncbi:MAG: DNA primase [Mycoplasma sp.]|nr:DNA primase [Mycoplasma sp.]